MSQEPSQLAGPMRSWARLKEHRVLQWSLAYLGAALALAHGQELLAHAFHWPELVERLMMGLLAAGFPLAITLAWYHGHKGLPRIGQGELMMLSLLLLIGAGLLVFLVRTPAERAVPGATMRPGVEPAIASGPGAAPARTKARRLAILPFDNLSPDSANAFFADGLHEDIISTLATRAPALEVISRTTMMLYRAAPKPVLAVARELGATDVMEGSVRRQGDHVRLTLQLIDGATDSHLWAQTYDRTLKDALSLQAEVAEEVASQLALRLPGIAHTPTAPTADPEAYDLYLKARIARQELNPNLPTVLEDIDRVTDLLEQAVQRDPNFALARVELANHRLQLFGLRGGMDNLERATAQLDRAAAVTPGESVLVVTRAYSEYLAGGPRVTSLSAVSEALKGPTQDTINLQIGQALLDSAGHFDDSLQLFRGWARLDPGNLLILDLYASELLCTRRPREALQIFDIMNARSVQDIFRPARGRVLFAYTGSTRELRAALDAVPQLPSDYRIWFEFDALRFERRYEELLRLLTRTPVQRLIPPPDNYSFLVGVPVPVAELRGWTALLAGDSAVARAAGAELATVVAEAHTSEVGAWYLATLNAEAHLLAGARAAAIAEARRSLVLRPRAQDALTWREVALRNARVLAWAGAQDEAVALLETLSSGDNGLGPAEITRDPLYDRPLADNARYRRLRARLEAEIGTTRLE